jgi:hypothetical protein
MILIIVIIIIVTSLGHLKVTCFDLSLHVAFFQMVFNFFLSDGILDLVSGICGVSFGKRFETNYFCTRVFFLI